MAKLKIDKANVFQNIGSARKLLSKRDRNKFTLLTIAQSILGLLDLASVALVGVISAVAVNGISNEAPSGLILNVLEVVQLENFTIQSQAAILGAVIGALLVLKSFLSMLLNKRMLFFLGHRSARISRILISKLVQQNALVIESNSAQSLIYSATTGINSIVIGVLGNFSALVGDVSLCTVLLIGLFLYSPGTTIFTVSILGFILLILFFYLNRESVKLTKLQTNLGIINAELLSELLDNYREAVVRNRRGYYEKAIAEVRGNFAMVTAKQTWLPNISKYVIEVTITIFTLLLAYLQFQSKDAVQAVGSLTIFLVAGARLAPSLLRIQHFIIAMNAHSEAAGPTFELFNRMSETSESSNVESGFHYTHDRFNPVVSIADVNFSYPGSNNLQIVIPKLEIRRGEFVALVGPSGAGKSTIVDLILGILEPLHGSVLISTVSPLESFKTWPGAVAHVSQRASFPTGSVRTCIAGGYELNQIPDELIWESLEKASLADYVRTLPAELDESLGEKAVKLSGGQRQRLAIARALLTRPRLLVMDEATSSLDSETEIRVSEAIQKLRGETTLLVVAHRLSTVRMADRIIYVENGRVLSEGTFDELRVSVPNFDVQAKLMGL